MKNRRHRGSGLIGKKLVNNLRRQGHQVVVAFPFIGREYSHR